MVMSAAVPLSLAVLSSSGPSVYTSKAVLAPLSGSGVSGTLAFQLDASDGDGTLLRPAPPPSPAAECGDCAGLSSGVSGTAHVTYSLPNEATTPGTGRMVMLKPGSTCNTLPAAVYPSQNTPLIIVDDLEWRDAQNYSCAEWAEFVRRGGSGGGWL